MKVLRKKKLLTQVKSSFSKKVGLTYKNQGLTLVEMLFAISMTTIILIAMVALMTHSLAQSQYARNKAVADSLVREGIEWARSVRDTTTLDWETFVNSPLPSPPPVSSPFVRTVESEIYSVNPNDKKKKIQVIVSWTDAKGTHNTQSTIYLSRW